MGRQDGLVLFTGSVGNITFYKNRLYGYLVRKKTGVSRGRIMTDPAYKRTRENISEFSRGGRATKLLRQVFASVRKFSTDSKVTTRMASTFMKVIQEDKINARGERTVAAGNVTLFEGFDFNANAPLTKSFQAPFTASIERATGRMTVDIPAFAPHVMIIAPEGSTHFRFKAVGAAVDFDNGTFSLADSESPGLALSESKLGPFQLVQTITPALPESLMLAFGVEFVQMVNGTMVALSDMSFNAMAIVKVERPNPSPDDLVNHNLFL